MALEKIDANAPSEVSPVLKRFIDTRKEVRNEARKRLEAVLEKTQLDQLQLDFMAGVDVATTSRKTPSPTPIIFRQMSRDVILNRLKELEKLSNRLFNPFNVETLHEMRIAAKRLRYAIELFQRCWGRSIATYAKRAARVQTALGDLHDCDVWIENLGKQINNARKNKDTGQVAAFVWLLNHFVKLRSKHLRQAFAEWSKWEAQDLSAKLRGRIA